MKLKIKLYTQWKNGEVVCTCPITNKCKKEHGCELLDFTLDSYADMRECMKHDSYARVKGAMSQRR